ncbi:MAG: hypothetical protein HKN32_09820 [Flavobacteriales bacterium]|nr:hypothetical protein [Flavobacteriales bacterium]
MNDKRADQTEVRLDRYTLKVVIDAFSYMIEHYHVTGVIDHAAWIIDKSELEAMVDKLKPHTHLDQHMAIIGMAEKEHNVYVRLIDYAGYAAPKQEDRAVLETLHDAYMESEETQKLIYFTVTLPHNTLAALVAVNNRIIDDPEILEFGLYDLPPWDDFLAVTAKLKNLVETAGNKVTVPMTFGEWVTQNNYSTQPLSRSIGELTPDEEQVVIDVDYEIAKVIASIPRQ